MIKVLKSGFYSSIQDAGRFGYRHFGVPVSGSMDAYASKFANLIIGNTEDASVLEITMMGPELQFLKPTIIAVSGADMQPSLNNSPIKLNIPIKIFANDVLSFGKLQNGIRAYISVKGGFKTAEVLGSNSMYKNITTINRISVDDKLDYADLVTPGFGYNSTVKYDNSLFSCSEIEAYKGPEFDKLTTANKDQLFNAEFKISKLNNRMAYQLEPLVPNLLTPILTSPVLPGTVQLTPSGRLIVLMRDCQTTGGYPRILQLTGRSINILSQKHTGMSLKINQKTY